MGKKSRIIPRTEPLHPRLIPIPGVKTRLTVKAAFGRPLQLKFLPNQTGPACPGYKCVAAWDVLVPDPQVEEFLEVSERIGNVQKLFHGTAARNITAIAEMGLRPGRASCMFGAGIYMGGIAKAMNYTGWSEGAHYLLMVEAALGKVKPCESAEKHTWSRLQAEGYNSVGGFAGMTASWGGTLRHNEYVVYDTAQVLVHRVLEYQPFTDTKTFLTTEGKCALIREKDVALTAMNRAFRDVVSRQRCDRTAYTRVDIEPVKTRAWLQAADLNPIWICADCIQKFKLRKGMKVEVAGQGYSRTPTRFVVLK